MLARNKGNRRNQRRNIKSRNRQIIRDYKSSGCVICLYNNCMRALHLHHVNENLKNPALTGICYASSVKARWSTVRLADELQKCLVLCANCHAEVHDGLHPEYLVTRHLDRVVEEDLQRELAFNWESK